MSLLLIGGFVLGVLVGGAVMAKFWEKIKNWLNTVAADAVERAFGYSARDKMHKAVAIIDRLVSKLKNTSVIYTKKNRSDTYFSKTTVISEAPVEDIEADVLEEIAKHNNHITQTFDYVR